MADSVSVSIPSMLRSYSGAAEVAVEVGRDGATVATLLDALDGRYPGLRFRVIDEQGGIRPHMRIFVDREAVDGIEAAIHPNAEVHILQHLSGG